MKVLYFIVFIYMPNNTYDVTSMPVTSCPSKEATQNYYDQELKSGRFERWGALCVEVDLSLPKERKT